MTAANEVELSIVESILRAEGIPLIKRYLNAGDAVSLYIGFTNSEIRTVRIQRRPAKSQRRHCIKTVWMR